MIGTLFEQLSYELTARLRKTLQYSNTARVADNPNRTFVAPAREGTDYSEWEQPMTDNYAARTDL